MNDIETKSEFENFVTVRKFRDLPEALLAKGSLESAGIECNLLDDNMVRLDWFWSNLIGWVRLQVASAEADEATAILDPQSRRISMSLALATTRNRGAQNASRSMSHTRNCTRRSHISAPTLVFPSR